MGGNENVVTISKKQFAVIIISVCLAIFVANIVTIGITGALMYQFRPGVFGIGNTTGYLTFNIPGIGRIRAEAIVESIINVKLRDPPPTSFPIKP